MNDREHPPAQPESEQGYTIQGDVHTGAFGTGASANVGAIGRDARGIVFAPGSDDEQERLLRLLDLVERLRTALDEHRETTGELHAAIIDRVDEIEEDLEEGKPPTRIRRKLADLAEVVKPFGAIAEIVGKLLALLKGGEG